MPNTSSVGMNLAIVSFYGTEFPFLNRMKSASGWIATGYDPSLIPLDAHGYPTGFPAGSSGVYTMVGLDPLSAGTSNTYVLTYTGTATFTLLGAKILSSEPGKITFQYLNADSTQMLLAVNSIDAKAPLGNMALVRSDQVGLYAKGEIFNPEFTGKISAFDTLRYMDWTQTNENHTQNWSDRTTMDDRTWQGGVTTNVPIEVMVALANKTKTDMWLNVPTRATDDYVRQMMTYVRDHLDPALSIQLEYSNEVWNWGFEQAHYAQAEGTRLWGTDANGDGKIDPADPKEQFGPGWVTWYGYRAAQVANVANQVFAAAPGRLHNVLTSQTTYQGLENYVIDGVARAGVGSIDALFDDWAVTTYFDGMLRGATDADRAIILSWAKSGSAGMAAAFAALRDGTGLTAGDSGSLSWLRGVVAYQAGVAKKLGLNLVSYEGGIDLTWSTAPYGADGTVIADFFKRLLKDPRMGDIYTQLVGDFAANGGTLLNILADVDSSNWGTLKTIYDQGSPAWDALVAVERGIRGASAVPIPVPAPPGPGLPPGLTDQADYVMAPDEKIVAYTGTGRFTATGNDLDNTITAGNGGSALSGGAGADVLVGGTGADRLDGGSGADTLVGGAGDDSYVVDNMGDVVVEKANGGTDEVRTSLPSYTLDDDVENLTYTGAAAFTGTGNAAANVLTAGAGGSTFLGGAGNDRLVGGAGVDWLDGGTGDDVMAGGAGDDTYVVDSVGDQVTEAADGGTDTVRTALASYTLPDRVENLVYVGVGAVTATGNADANTITGGAGADRLSGGAGNDVLIGGAGDDLLDGGSGDDVLRGGAGDDSYVVDSAGDQVVEAAGEGTDTVRTVLAAYTLPDRVENLVYVGVGAFAGTGNADANALTCGAGADRLAGGAGNDTLFGGGGNDLLDGGAGDDLLDGGSGDDVLRGGVGNDVYVVDSAGDQAIEVAGEGTDEVRTALAAYALGANIETLTYTGAGAFAGTGNADANTITGGAGDDRLAGAAGDDTLSGGAGNDLLDGGEGVDRMIGGAGNDTYVVDDYRDQVVETANGGTDEVRTALGSYVLPDQVEKLTFVGSGQFQAIGNALDNVITGGAGSNRLLGGDGNDTLTGGDAADVLDGGTGADRMVGGGGNDIYFVDSAGDAVVEAPGGGLDTVYSAVSYTLADSAENLQLIGPGTLDGAGNALANTIVGSIGDNRLSGGDGADLLYGGGGNDVLSGDGGDDTLVGDQGNDALNGGAGDDTLVGGEGDDVLAGGAGADSLTGGVGADRFTFKIGDLSADLGRTDRITDFSREDGDRIDLSDLDANPATAGRDAFTFISTAAFGKHAGELRIDGSGGYQVVLGDLDGDGVADFALNVSKGAGTLLATDFVL